MFGKIYCEPIRSRAYILGEVFDYWSSFLFQFSSVSSRFSLVWSYMSRNVPISSRLLSLLECNFSSYSYNSFFFPVELVVMSSVSFQILVFWVLSFFLSFFFLPLVHPLSILVMCSKNQFFVPLIFLLFLYSLFYFALCFNNDYFHPSVSFGFRLFDLFTFKIVTD